MSTHARILEEAPDGSLSPENRRYLEKVLRLRPGDSFKVTDGKGRQADAQLGDGGSFRAGGWTTPRTEPEFPVTIFPALTKGDGVEWLIEKVVESGATRIVPVLTARCVVRPPSGDRLERWGKIAISAMLQCGGCMKPSVEPTMEIARLPSPTAGICAVVLHESLEAGIVAPFTLLTRPKELWIASGPEGGLTDEEIEAVRAKGWTPLWLGNRRFRAETAPLVALAALLIKPHA